MIKREANFGEIFRHYLRAHPWPRPAAFELKQTTANAIAFDSVQPHQINALASANSTLGILYKAPDDSRGIKPFDYFYLVECDAYIVIKYPHFFVVIALVNFLREKQLSERKSLTASRAREIAHTTVDM